MLRFLILFAWVGLVTAAKFPPYISKCARDDPAFNKCALASARAAKNYILRGDRAFRLIPLDPLLVTQMGIEQPGTVGLNCTLNNVKITGLADVEFNDNFSFDLGKQVLHYELVAPRVELNSDYVMQGRILILPIAGNGKVNFTLTSVDVQVTSPYKIVTKDNGKEYLFFLESTMTMNPKRVYTNFSNLFNGDPLLGTQTNLFINENWKALSDDFGPIIAKGVVAAVQQSIQGFVDKIPYDELIPKKL